MIEQTERPTAAPDAPATASAPRISAKLIENVGVELHAYLGSTRMTVGELTALAPGATVALDAPLNTVVELHMNGTVVARGELVAVDDRFGVRLTEIAQWPD